MTNSAQIPFKVFFLPRFKRFERFGTQSGQNGRVGEGVYRPDGRKRLLQRRHGSVRINALCVDGKHSHLRQLLLRLLLRQKTGEFFGEHGFFRFGVAHGDILNEVGKTAERLKNAFSQPSLLYSVRQSVYVALRAQKYGVVVAGKKFFVSLVLRQALVKQVVPPALSYVERKRHAGLIEAAVAAGYGSEADRLFPQLFFICPILSPYFILRLYI